MRIPRQLSQFAGAIAATSLVAGPMLQARAQTATATATAAANPAQPDQMVNPPTRVARLASISGTVSFHTAAEDHWDPATVNYPMSTGEALWTEPDATASVEVSASRIDLGSSTEFDLDQLDPHVLVATQAQGETFLRLQDLVPGDSYTVRTPRGSVTMTAAGQYEIASGDTQTPTTVTVIDGAAQITADNVALSVEPGQTATITGSGSDGDQFGGSTGPLVRDAFLQTELSATTTTAEATVTAHATATATAAPPSVREIPGAQQLADYGTWENNSQYGEVWRPAVGRDWVPYRDGHWAFVAPWGWTWIDGEPWGYAPFHYGRWVEVDSGWAWAPTYYDPAVVGTGYVAPAYLEPVYAPALVSFFGFGVGLSVGLGVGFGFGPGFGFASVGWCPLGWGEPYRPWFGGGPRYFNAVNRTSVVNINSITYNNLGPHNTTIDHFANAAAGATVVPTSAMVNSERVHGREQPFSRQQFAEAHSLSAVPSPTVRTAGVTPAVAQRLGLADAAEARHGSAPGPAVTPAPLHGRVPLRPASGTAAAAGTPLRGGAAAAAEHGASATTPLAAHEPNATGNRIGEAANHAIGLPALRSPGMTTHAERGAPGPPFTPHARGATGPTLAAPGGNRTVNERTAAAGRSAPGPVFASRGAGNAGVIEHAGLPALRTPAAAAESHAPRLPTAGSLANRFAEAPGRETTLPPRAEHNFAAPQHFEASRRFTPPVQQRAETPRYQAPQQRFQAQPRVEPARPQVRAPEPRIEPTRPQVATPAPRFEPARPQVRAPAPRIEAPRAAAPRPVPAPRPAAGSRRPWPP
jgi:hypothetical protein